jgi:hypothetical protein
LVLGQSESSVLDAHQPNFAENVGAGVRGLVLSPVNAVTGLVGEVGSQYSDLYSLVSGSKNFTPSSALYNSLQREGIGGTLVNMGYGALSAPSQPVIDLLEGRYEQAGAGLPGMLTTGFGVVRGVRRGGYGAIGNAGIGGDGRGLTISSNPATGNPAAIARGMGSLNARQVAALEQLPHFGSKVILGKNFGQGDLAALTAATGDEFAMFTTGGRRLVFRGDYESVPVTPGMAADLAGQGWRWSAHTHPGFDTNVLRSSSGDQAVLSAMGGSQSAIFNSLGQRGIFTPAGDSLNGWMPW